MFHILRTICDSTPTTSVTILQGGDAFLAADPVTLPVLNICQMHEGKTFRLRRQCRGPMWTYGLTAVGAGDETEVYYQRKSGAHIAPVTDKLARNWLARGWAGADEMTFRLFSAEARSREMVYIMILEGRPPNAGVVIVPPSNRLREGFGTPLLTMTVHDPTDVMDRLFNAAPTPTQTAAQAPAQTAAQTVTIDIDDPMTA